MMPRFLPNFSPVTPEAILATSGDKKSYGTMYYIKGAAAGGICCSVTHGALCPVDVVKTRIQLDPVTYNRGMIGGFRQVIAAEGAGALLTGLGATAFGYFVQGWFKVRFLLVLQHWGSG
jgi:solute carrier family 25 phosphate transporter 3